MNVGMAYRKKAIANMNTVLLDVGSPEEFNGSKESKIRKGSILGSVNVEFKHLLNSKKILKRKEESVNRLRIMALWPIKK